MKKGPFYPQFLTKTLSIGETIYFKNNLYGETDFSLGKNCPDIIHTACGNQKQWL